MSICGFLLGNPRSNKMAQGEKMRRSCHPMVCSCSMLTPIQRMDKAKAEAKEQNKCSHGEINSQ